MAQEAKKKIKKRPKKAKPPKLPWRQRVTLSGVILWSVLATILMVSTGIGSYALYVLHNNKLTDTWAILFLELEQQGNWLLQRLEDLLFTAFAVLKTHLFGSGSRFGLHRIGLG